MVTSAGGSQHAADPRNAFELQKSIVGRLEEQYHVKAVGTADTTWDDLLNKKPR
jgi:hypothetical protein